ncbi:MAG: heme-binding protein [Verrucomicrobia bacterium]|nr:heme-binding protein [Verrucomicrobiota bacterium]
MSAAPAFPSTAPGVTELKTLPAGLLVRSEAKGDYFEKSGDLFRPLFRYIQRKDISMTTPVESHVGDTSAMYFWIGTTERAKAETDLDSAGPRVPEGVVVLKRAEQLVASHGGRGGYSREHFEEARDAVVAWVASQADLAITGEAYGVYWSSPFTLPFLKRYEVHVPVRRLAAKTGG